MWYIFFPRGDYMKQMHLRVDDALYEELNTYSVETEQSMQACVREAVAYYITDKKKKQIPVLKSQFTFIDLFAEFAYRFFNIGRETGVHFCVGTDAHSLAALAPEGLAERLKEVLL